LTRVTLRLFSITMDAESPARQAEFWSQVTGYEVILDPEGNEYCIGLHP
jgi:hypothetical protein